MVTTNTSSHYQQLPTTEHSCTGIWNQLFGWQQNTYVIHPHVTKYQLFALRYRCLAAAVPPFLWVCEFCDWESSLNPGSADGFPLISAKFEWELNTFLAECRNITCLNIKSKLPAKEQLQQNAQKQCSQMSQPALLISLLGPIKKYWTWAFNFCF